MTNLTESGVEDAAMNVRESSTPIRTRDLLLPKLIFGDVLSREAEKVVEAIA